MAQFKDQNSFLLNFLGSSKVWSGLDFSQEWNFIQTASFSIRNAVPFYDGTVGIAVSKRERAQTKHIELSWLVKICVRPEMKRGKK